MMDTFKKKKSIKTLHVIVWHHTSFAFSVKTAFYWKLAKSQLVRTVFEKDPILTSYSLTVVVVVKTLVIL